MFTRHHGRSCGGERNNRRQARDDFGFGGGQGRGRGFGGHGHGHGAGRGRRGGRLGRLFAHGDLHYVILHLTAEKPRHGYELIKAIEAMVGGSYTPSPGTIYPALTMLEEQGYVTVEAAEGSKKLYAVTDEGRAYLETNQGAVQALLQRMEQASREADSGPAPQIIRAMENLKLALNLRLGADDLSDEQVQTVAAILDKAAAEIERS